jgi:hypothetical protein
MERKLFLVLIIVWFLLIGCASQQLHKEATPDKLGILEFNERKHSYETFDELANRLRASPSYVVLKKKEIIIDGDMYILELADRDGDGKADSFAYTPKKGGGTQDFGFIFDLNKDGKIDYIVFNQGLAITKDMKPYWSKYHWIDSNFDGKIDIHVLPTIDLDGDKFPDKGVTAWIFDIDFDGDVDKVEYWGEDFQKPVEKTKGIFIIKAWTGKSKVGKDYFSTMSKRLSEINSLYP